MPLFCCLPACLLPSATAPLLPHAHTHTFIHRYYSLSLFLCLADRLISAIFSSSPHRTALLRSHSLVHPLRLSVVATVNVPIRLSEVETAYNRSVSPRGVNKSFAVHTQPLSLFLVLCAVLWIYTSAALLHKYSRAILQNYRGHRVGRVQQEHWIANTVNPPTALYSEVASGEMLTHLRFMIRRPIQSISSAMGASLVNRIANNML